MILDVRGQVSGEERPPRPAVKRGAADRHRLEDEKHPPCEVRVAVLVATDLAAEILKRHALAEDPLDPGWPTAERGRHLLDRRSRIGPGRPLEQDDDVVIALASNLAPPP